jgi:Zc3h12a-like Ribonuclease NYN domain
VPLAESHHVVVDGSNLATEGRTFPSLEQLDEAVRAYAAEDPAASIIVVVDATFEHRVAEPEREEVRLAMLNGEVISPPAGAIGRGDAFVLRIAERTGATVLSNDSFQEFHGEHPWLFDEGRLIGGKPVPGVGWIFTPRLPIRGPKSRAATAEARAKKDPESAPAKAAELAKAAKQAAKKASKAQSARKKGAPVDSSWPLTPTAPPPGRAKVNPEFSSAIDEAVEEALHPPLPQRPRGAAQKHAAAKKAAPPKSAKAKKDTTSRNAAIGRGAHPRAEGPAAQGPRQSQKKRSAPPPAVNEPLTFINFVAAFSVGSTIAGEVVSFTSHGAMVDVPLPGGGALHCYIPLTAMGSPPPTKARQVLKKGEVRPFVLAGLDPPRRVAELALPPSGAVAATRTPAKQAVTAKWARTAKAAPSTNKAAAKKASPPAKKATKKAVASAKKAPQKAAVKKAAKTKQSPAKKAAVKKAAKTKQSAAKKSPAKKATKAQR